MRRKITALALVLAMSLSLTACGGEEEPTRGVENAPAASTGIVDINKAPASDQAEAEDGSWAVYWYLCGSDLETNWGAATTDLVELMEVQLPENVNIVIQTGGAAVWQNDYMDPSKVQRWLYNHEGLFLVEEAPMVNMGAEV